MKAHIYKPEQETKYYICVEAEDLLESLAIDGLREKEFRGYADIIVEVAGIGIFEHYGKANYSMAVSE